MLTRNNVRLDVCCVTHMRLSSCCCLFMRVQPRRKGYALRASAKALVQQYYYMTQVGRCCSLCKYSLYPLRFAMILV
jgi:hypothetical protein